MTAIFAQTAFQQLPPLPANFTGDPLQTTQALTGLGQALASWTLRISNAMNLLIPNGGPVPVSQGGTGASSFTTHGVLIGEGTAPIQATAAGASGIPLIGQGAANPVFGTAVVAGGGTGAITLTAHGVLLGEGTSPVSAVAPNATAGAIFANGSSSTDPAYVPQWTVNSSHLIGNFNAVTLPALDTGSMIQLGNADATTCAIETVTSQASGRITGKRSEGTINSPTATSANATIIAIRAEGYANGAYTTGAAASIQLNTKTNTWSASDNGTAVAISTTPDGSVTPAMVATFKNEGCVLQGTISNDNAAAGFVGEYISQIVLIANEVNINAAANVAQLTNLPVGDWDVWGEAWLDTNTGTATLSASGFRAALTSTTATLPTVPADNTARTNVGLPTVPASISAAVYPIGPIRVSLAAATTYFLVAAASVSAGTAFGYGKICARRRR